MTITNPTPEPGQHVYVEFVAERWEAGGTLLLLPVLPDGGESDDLGDALEPHRVVWRPADVPPQPPVLAEGMIIRVAGDEGLWTIDEADLTPHACLWLTEVADAPPADVPGPDDSTPTSEPDDAVCRDCGGSGYETQFDGTGYPVCMGCGGSGADESEPQPHEGEQL